MLVLLTEQVPVGPVVQPPVLVLLLTVQFPVVK
jgi:hypothetical protein